MIREIVYCKKCVHKLGKYGNMPLDLYCIFCKYYADGEILYCEAGRKGQGDYLIHFLELKGYIVTTESKYKEFLAIKPIGYKKKKTRYIESHEVCAFRNEHKKNP